MDPLSSLDGIAELIRRKIASDPATRSDFRAVAKSSVSAAKSEISQKKNFTGLKLKVLEQIKAIDVSDPKRSHKAIRCFVQNILTWQFGEELLNDPGFTGLLEKVTVVLESDPLIAEQLLSMSKA